MSDGLECRVCGSTQEHRRFLASEMMFGTRAQFEYLECGACGSLQIVALPPDLSCHYPSRYHALGRHAGESGLKRFLRARWASHAVGERSALGAALTLALGTPEFPQWLRKARIGRTDRILDVGCGSGYLLRLMHSAGFQSLLGIDPFLDRDSVDAEGLVRLKCTLEQLHGLFDFVMLHHSFEHMADPGAVLANVRRLLRPGSPALIRVPVAGSFAWRTYGPDWVQLDPPRHLFVPSESGMRLLARRAGFDMVEVVYDSYGLQFWGSEQNRRGIPLSDRRSVANRRRRGLFSSAELRRYDREAAELNARGEGDQACFYLRKA